jgi:hypothetical protein
MPTIAAAAHTSAETANSADPATLMPQVVERRAAELARALDHRPEHRAQVAQPGAAVHEREPRARPAGERLRLGRRHRALEQLARLEHALLPRGVHDSAPT